MLYLEDSDFDGYTLKLPGRAFILISSKNCPHCQRIQPMFEELATIMNGKVWIATVPVNDSTMPPTVQALAKRIQSHLPVPIQGVPMFILYKNGKFATIHTGERSIKEFIKTINGNYLTLHPV